MQTILITGSEGFLGTNFINYLSNFEGFELIALDSLNYAGEKNHKFRSQKSLFVKADLFNVKELEDLFEKFKFDFVVNFAAETHVDNSISDARPFINSNIVGVFNLLNISREHSIKHFIQISTDEVYGSTKSGFFDENSIIKPSSPYSASKAAAENLVMAYSKTFGLCTTILRLCNNFGPFQNSEKFIPASIIRLINRKPIKIYGTGKNIREWIYVRDSNAAISKVLYKIQKLAIYNISSGFLISNLELAKSLNRIFGYSKDNVEYTPDRLGHDFRYALNSNKFEQVFGKIEVGNFYNNLEKTVTWYQSEYGDKKEFI